MNFITVIAFALGLIIGGLSCAVACSGSRRRATQATTEQLRHSGALQDNLFAAVIDGLRGVLAQLESEKFAAAKSQLAGLIAILYNAVAESRRTFALPPPQPDRIGEQLRLIEADANRFESLRTAISQGSKG